AMSPYEIAAPGGSVEHWNAESGHAWLSRALAQWPNSVWINPVRQAHWDYTHSIRMIRDIFSDRMFPLTLKGLDEATRELSRKH
ncbi:MAG: VWA domain-containing protein, partial [Notoacmeibacter sp.]|nr:VWA domain-containing protein [Notoacmeibacter sp.]